MHAIVDHKKDSLIPCLTPARVIKPRAKRWCVDEVIDIYEIGSRNRIGFLSDISETGLGIISSNKVETGKTLNLKLAVKTNDSALSNVEFIELRGHIVRIQQKKIKQLYKIGLSFKPLNAKSKIRLIRLLSNLEKSHT
ncbi:PilZ domain-containing protein [Marinicella sp. W31]|uniref:PilZ domain-containing protein n=1 Tax=Marinicella sp. W31 TaxID=3023713 RepID=UPI0037564DA8